MSPAAYSAMSPRYIQGGGLAGRSPNSPSFSPTSPSMASPASPSFSPASPLGFSPARPSGMHHNNYGSYELAKCVVEGIRSNVPHLAGFIREDTPSFDPARPDEIESFAVPPSARTTRQPPDAN